METFGELFKERNPKYAFLVDRMNDALGVDVIAYTDITSANLRKFKEYMEQKVTANSLKTYFAILRSTIKEMSVDGLIGNVKCIDVLKVKATPSQHISLTEEELVMIDEYVPRSQTENDVKILFMRGAFSGARSCDCSVMSNENVNDGMLTYVSKKTKTGVVQPLHNRLAKYIEQKPSKQHSRAVVNSTIQNICRRLGFTDPVTLSRKGMMITKPKYRWITMHDSRRSFCTSLAVRGVPVETIAKLAGHKNSNITSSRYICIDTRNVGDAAMAFFNG